MDKIKFFKNEDLVLKVKKSYDPSILNLDEWMFFIDTLCQDREYQKEAIINAIIFLAGKQYSNTEDLLEENYKQNINLQSKFLSLNDAKMQLQIKNKLFANIDLATGTGKSYLIYGIAQIMLGLGLVDQVLVLCPSLTIESGLMDKFISLSGNSRLKATIPKNALIKNPRIIDANVTIKKGDICVENIHAVYENTGSSINDSLKGKGERTLVLNDESHHIFNASTDKDVKKWKDFLINSDYNFKYILGFTGTAYINNEYFIDVIYRYSLKEAIEQSVVKNIEYVQKDDTINDKEKFQKIYQNHIENKEKYSMIKPISILITKDITNAKRLTSNLITFLQEKEQLKKEVVEKKVLIVTSHRDHASNIVSLKSVDEKENSYEWIVSVSMLTEGWDVKNVFQIVPWQDRAFNSKLLIAQVLGRGLRIPPEYATPQPKVTIFNHDSWSRNIKDLVEEVLEIETRLYSTVLLNEERSKYNFEVHNLNYDKTPEEKDHIHSTQKVDYTRMFTEGVALQAQTTHKEKETFYTGVLGSSRSKDYVISYETFHVDEIVDKIYQEFNIRDWEGRVLQLGEDEYTQNNLPSRKKIKDMIIYSMRKVGIKGDFLTEKNRTIILKAFGTMLRKKGKTTIIKTKIKDPFLIKTIKMPSESLGTSNLRRDSTVFYTTNYEEELREDQKLIVDLLISDQSLPRSAIKEINNFQFKTSLNLVFSKSGPERKFIEFLCNKKYINSIDSWIKSRDLGFYSIEYSWRKSTHQISNQKFNPDFFIKINKNGFNNFLVVEIKADKDVSEQNKAKYYYAKLHFKNLNNVLEERGIKEKYLFHFLSPNAYTEFFQWLEEGTLLEDQKKFRCELENLLEE